jgi:hypothetical protein
MIDVWMASVGPFVLAVGGLITVGFCSAGLA